MNKIWKIAAAAAVALSVSETAYAMKVIPSGECVGVKLYTNGLVVCDTAEVTTRDGKRMDLAKGYGIARGDIITAINGKAAAQNESVKRALWEDPESITLTVEHNGQKRDVTITPADTREGPKLGLWLRDSTAGMGTVTCYVGGSFAALGHGICDIDTGNIMPAGSGIIQEPTSVSVIKGKNGEPGAISGEINGEVIGRITANKNNGLFGTADAPDGAAAMETASKNEVRCGQATVMCDVDGEGVKEYMIEIKRIYATSDGRDMIIKVTDPALIEKTGGIVQGMSGAPIIQNGRLAGAVTHVFVNDPLSGYAIFADNLLKDIRL